MFDLQAEIRKHMRVLQVASLPRFKDFERMVVVTGSGVVLMGAIGLIISFVLNIH